MRIAKIDNGKILVGEHDELFGNTSFPDSGIHEAFLSENDCLLVSDFIEHDAAVQKLVAVEPYIVGGVVYTVMVADKSRDDKEYEKSTAAIKSRAERNKLLAATDFTQLADSPVDAAAWAEYRQALREVPEQAGFPFNIEWPVQP